MDAAELLKQLDRWHDGIPNALLREAVKRREEVVPGLIAALEEVVANPKTFLDDPERNLYYWAAYLLAHFEEEQALGAMIGLVRLSGGEFEDLVGDLIVDGAMLLANVAGETVEPIAELLHDRGASEDARAAAVDALGLLCAWGVVEQERIVPEFQRALEQSRKEDKYFAATIVNAAADLNLRTLEMAVKDAYAREVVDTDLADLEFVGEWLHDPDFEPPPPYIHLVQSVEDIVEFFEEKLKDEAAGDDELDLGNNEDAIDLLPATADDAGHVLHSGGTYHAAPKPGRNDPCPCGSGKKYKKCCGV